MTSTTPRPSAFQPVSPVLASHRRVKAPLILVVDDDRSTTRAIEGFLASAGFRTVCAGNIAGALERIREERPDLILLDVELPDGSGFDLCRTLRADTAVFQAPVLFISAHDDVFTKVQGFKVGGVDYLTKPVAGAEVLARVRTHLRLKHAYERLAELQAERIHKLAIAQQNLMPQPDSLPEARFQVAVHQELSAGGDFYDVIPVGERLFDYLVADSSGHDLAASYWTAALKALAVEYGGPVNVPEEMIRAINGALCRFLPVGAFFTLIFARINHQSGQLSIVNAGHPPAILVPVTGDGPKVIWQEGDVVGAFSDAVFGCAELAMKPGDRLFLYTDGLVERGRCREDGIQRLADACYGLRSLDLKDLIPAVVDEITGSTPGQDDTVLLGVQH